MHAASLARLRCPPARSAASAPPKGKDKKAARKAEQAAAQARLNHIKNVLHTEDGAERDLLSDFAPFTRFDRNGVQATLSFASPATMDADTKVINNA